MFSFVRKRKYLDDAEYELTDECEIMISSLAPNTTYQIDVCVVTMKGKGSCASVDVKTHPTGNNFKLSEKSVEIKFYLLMSGDIFPAPPTFSVIGRRELHVKWQAPKVMSGRLSRYELMCNGQRIYSGVGLECHATRLQSDTEYTIVVIVVTNEGRFCSPPAKARTLKTERLYYFCFPN